MPSLLSESPDLAACITYVHDLGADSQLVGPLVIPETALLTLSNSLGLG